MSLNSIQEIIDDIHQGRMVILMDDEDRENEGDLVLAASKVTDKDINFMARFGRGLICLTLMEERCRALGLPLMVSTTQDKHKTNFTVSIEAAEGVTTGISAADRAKTIATAVDEASTQESLVQPGHVFPLMAKAGGVLTRAGHTEAGCDLARLAGHSPASVIVEILNEDGTMARRPELEVFAKQHGLKIGMISDLIKYRLEHEMTVECVATSPISIESGDFMLHTFVNKVDDSIHYALVKGEIAATKETLVRVHMLDTLYDVLQINSGSSLTLKKAMDYISKKGSGVVVMLKASESNDSIISKVEALSLKAKGKSAAPSKQVTDLRSYGVGAQILRSLGVSHMQVLGSPIKLHALSGFGLEVVEYIDIILENTSE